MVSNISKVVFHQYSALILFTVFIFSESDTIAQRNLKAAARTTSVTNPTEGNYYYAHRDEPPRAIEFEDRTVTTAYFLANINKYLTIPTEFSFKETESNTDNRGMKHTLIQQYYKDIPIEGMYYRTHEKDGFIKSANGKAIRTINLNTQVNISEEQAYRIAVTHLQTKDTTIRHGKKLIVSKEFRFSPESFSIAFQFDIDVSLIERWRISIDARSGEVINKISLVANCLDDKPVPLPYGSGTGLTRYYGSKTIKINRSDEGSSSLRGQTQNGGFIETYDFGNRPVFVLLFGLPFQPSIFYSSDDTYDDPYQQAGVSVHWAAEQAYEYYFTKHNRNSFDNNGSVIKSYVHVDHDLNNAFWTGKVLAFGDGSNNNPPVELDVVTHELTHAVTQYEAQLQYVYESGALNESFSDIFGKAVEFYTFGDTATWKFSKHYGDGGLRDFSNPNLKNQPDTYLGDMWYTGHGDNGGVHYNSGVQNFWFYLLCQGGVGINDHKMSYTVQPIGMDAAIDITYRNLTEYLSPNSDYLDSRIGSLLATADLYGKNSNIYQQVVNAWDAVGVIDEPLIRELDVYDITATTVKIKGTLLPRGDVVTYRFEYGPTPAYGSSSPLYNYTDKVEGIINGLQSETKYYLRLVATNEAGSSYATTEFTTISLAPLVRIKQTVDITETNATLYGEVNPNSLTTSFYFEYGLTPALGLTTSTYQLSDTTEYLSASASINNLQPRKTYYYRLKANNDFASATTQVQTFFTAVKPVITSYTPLVATIGTEITIKGENFNPTPTNNFVYFGAVRATILSSSTTEIKVKVPAGASHWPISLLDAESGLETESIQEFVPTYVGEFKKGSMQLRVGIADMSLSSILVQDIDGDNKPDIVGTQYPYSILVLHNVNSGGHLTNESFIRNTYALQDFSIDNLFVVDIDGDGVKDVVVYNGEHLRIFPNLSVPGFISLGVPVDVPIGSFGQLVFGDFDADGHIDIAGSRSISFEKSTFIILRNQTPKGFISAKSFEARYTLPLSHSVQTLFATDMNNDGTRDIVAAIYYDNFLSVLRNKSFPGTFEFEEQMIYDSSRGSIVSYFSHDLNQDNWKDIISHEPYHKTNLNILQNKGTSPNITLETPAVQNEQVGSAVKPADINGDGKVDLITALEDRTFVLLENKVNNGEPLTNSSFQSLDVYGLGLPESSNIQTFSAINDLNADGRPEVINAHIYGFYPHDGFNIEIWQNTTEPCIDPSLITLEVSDRMATIKLPPNTTFEQFEIEYTYSGYDSWWPVYSTDLDYLQRGTAYQLRVRTKCYLAYTDYHYIDFTTDCIDASDFLITNIEPNRVSINSNVLYSLEVQYSIKGEDAWTNTPQYSNEIINLLPGTTYDLRFRGICNEPAEFKYREFTTSCPNLSEITIGDIKYNQATVNSKGSYKGSATFEYSEDNANWILIGEDRIISALTSGKKYFVRGRMACTNIDSEFITASFITPCPKVSSISVDAISPFSGIINWTDESNADSFILKYAMLEGGSFTTVETSSTSFTLDGLHPGTQYKVAVAPPCIIPEDFTEKIFRTTCYAPYNVLLDAVTYTSAELSWRDDFGALPYLIDYSIAGSTVWLTTGTSSKNIILTKLRPGTLYEARVHINCMSQVAPYAALQFKTNLYDDLSFAPNPTDGKITIYPDENLIGNNFSVVDNTGRQVAAGKLLDYTIDLSSCTAGIYTLKIQGIKAIKIVKH